MYTDASGNNRTYTVAYKAYTLRSNFGCATLGYTYTDYNDSSAPAYLPYTITDPNGAVTTLTYETTLGVSGQAPYGTYTTGRIASITFGSGGSISYAYSQNGDSQGNNGIDCLTFVVPKLTVTVNDHNGNSGTYTYVNSDTGLTSPNNFTVTKTDPANNQTAYSFSGEYQTQVAAYQGGCPTSTTGCNGGGTLLKTAITCYGSNGSTPPSRASCAIPSALPSLPITETDVYTWLGTSSLYNEVQTKFDATYGNVLSVARYDWGSILASVTAGSGGSSNGISYGKYVPGTGCVAIGNYINDRPCSVDVYDGSNNLYSQVSYTYNATGHATSVYNWVSGSNSLTSSAAYGGNGAAAGVLSSVTDANGAITSFGNFACNGILSGSTTYPLASVGSDSQSWDCNGGVVSTKTDVNRNVTSYTYNDPLYRLTQIQYPDSSSDTLKISYSTGTNFPWQIVETKAVTNSTSVSLYTNLDGLGRKMKTATTDPTYGYAYQDFVYNALGELYSVDAPYYTSAGTLCANGGCVTTYTYDAMGRTISVTPPISSDATAISYNNRASEVTHAGISKVSQVDGLGRTVNVCEVTNTAQAGGPGPSACGLDITPSPNDGFLSGLSYDPLGRVTAMCAGASQCRNFAYDGLSRLTSESYPEVGNNAHTTNGTITYIYDALHAGDLYQRTAPLENQPGTATVVTTYTFDKMHRPTNISYNDGTTLAVGWAYDLSSYWSNTLSNGKGRVSFQSTSLNGGAADVIYGYDPMGNVNLYGQCSPQNCAVPNDFITSYTYNFVGEPAGGSTFVSGAPYWTNAYDPIGRLQSVWTSYLTNSSSGNLISGMTYNALGERTGDTLANGLSESWSYDNEGRVNGYSAGSLYNYGLTYTPLITSSTDSINSNYSYTYDGLGRLSTAGNGTNNFSYGFDRWGNRWNQTVMKGSGPPPTYYFNANNQSGSFTYDAAGNITNDGSHTYSYDAEGRVLQVDGGTTNIYVYNSRGMRAALAGAENLFDLNGNIVSVVTPGTATLAYNRYTVGGRLLATNSGNTTDFYHQDWLGGIRALSSLSGSLINSCTNLPFGDGTNNCGLWYFAGLMSDPWDTLNTSATRSQSPTSGRWLTPDPAGLAVMDPTNPQTWNRYAYVLNNPVSFTDPLGLEVEGGGSGTSGGEDVGGPGGLGDGGACAGFTDGAGSSGVTCGDFTFFLPTIPRISGISGPFGPSQPPGGGSTPPWQDGGSSGFLPGAANNGTQPPGVPKPPNPILQYDKCVTQNVNPAKNNAQKVSIINGVTNLNGLGLCAFTGPDAPLCVGVLGGVATVNSLVFWAGGQITVYDAETQCLQQN